MGRSLQTTKLPRSNGTQHASATTVANQDTWLSIADPNPRTRAETSSARLRQLGMQSKTGQCSGVTRLFTRPTNSTAGDSFRVRIREESVSRRASRRQRQAVNPGWRGWVYETNYLGISCCIRTTDEIMSSFVGLFWSTVQQLFPLDFFCMREVLGGACSLG